MGNNTHRRLDVAEFRGFALCDEYAPLIFVNGADAKSAQMFTLAHELAHLWLGSEGTGLSGFAGIFPEGSDVERFCDRAAAEFLVPEAELRARWPAFRREAAPFERLARAFKVSPIVTGRRAMDLRLVDRQVFFEFYEEYTKKELLQGRDDDELVKWVNETVPDSFFRSCSTSEIIESYTEVILWVQRNPQYFDGAKAQFATGADGWLVAYARVHGSTGSIPLRKSRLMHRKRQ